MAGRLSPADGNVAESKQLQELTPCCGDTSEAHAQSWTSVSPTIGGQELRCGSLRPKARAWLVQLHLQTKGWSELAFGDCRLHLGTMTEHLSKLLRRSHPSGDLSLSSSIRLAGGATAGGDSGLQRRACTTYRSALAGPGFGSSSGSCSCSCSAHLAQPQRRPLAMVF